MLKNQLCIILSKKKKKNILFLQKWAAFDSNWLKHLIYIFDKRLLC